jgi:hypothetical protein
MFIVEIINFFFESSVRTFATHVRVGRLVGQNLHVEGTGFELGLKKKESLARSSATWWASPVTRSTQ